MVITNARRTVRGSLIVTIDGDEWYVPETPGNRYYDELQSWLEQGNEILPAEEPQ